MENGPRRSWALGVADNTIYSLLTMAATRAVGLVVSVLVARRLGVESLGVFQQAAVLVTAFAAVATWGMPTSIVPLLACSDSENERQSLINASLFTAWGIAFVLALSLAVFSPDWAQWLLHRPLPGVLRLTAIGVVFSSGAALTGAWLQGLNQFRILANVIVASSIPSGIAIVVLTYAWGVGGAVSSISVVAVIFMLLAWVRCRDIRPAWKRPPKGALETVPRLLATGTAALAGGLPAVIAPLVFTWMLGARGVANAGFFALSQTVSQLLLFLPNALTMALLPPLSRLAEDDPDAGATAFNASLNVCGSIVLIGTAVLLGLLPWIIPLVYGREFGPGVLMISWFAIAAPVVAVNMIIAQYLLARKKFWKAAAFNAVWMFASVPCAALIIAGADPSWAGAGFALGHCLALLSYMAVIRVKQGYVLRTLGKIFLCWLVLPLAYASSHITGIDPRMNLPWMLLCSVAYIVIWRCQLTKAFVMIGPLIRKS